MTNPTELDLMALAEKYAVTYGARDIPTGGLYRGIAHNQCIDAKAALQSALTTLQSKLDAAEARVRELEKDALDAKRYRWLREEGRCNGFSVEQEKPGWITTHASHSLDAAIDAALSKETPK